MFNFDDTLYEKLQERQKSEWEAACIRCGACCGVVDGDPCFNLSKDSKGNYFCKIYENRFGIQKTKSGCEIKCVPVRDILHESWPGDSKCAYKNLQKKRFRGKI